MMDRIQIENLLKFLEGPEGCNFREVEDGGVRWSCDGTLHKTVSWMQEYGVDIAVELPHIVLRGGHCDCEVVFNVIDKLLATHIENLEGRHD